MPRCTCACGARYKFPESSLGKKSKCKKCGTILTLEPDDEGILAVAPESESDHLSAFTMQVQAAAATRAHHDHAEPPPPAPPTALRRSYGADVLGTFLFPSTPSNLISFVMTAIAMGILAPLARMVPLIGFFCSIMVSGWYAAYRLEILRNAAAGEDELPTLGVSRDIWEDAIEPLLQWMSSWFVVLLPALVFLVFCFQQGRIDGGDVATALFGGIAGLTEVGSGDMILLSILVIAGLCAWPIVVLCVALGGVGSLVRMDLIATTLVRTAGGYFITLALLLGAVALQDVVAGLLIGKAGGTQASSAGQAFGSAIAIYGLFMCASVYLDIVVMRLIGVYYYHFKGRFAWEWE